MLDGKDLLPKQPLSWKKGFEMGIVIPNKNATVVIVKQF